MAQMFQILLNSRIYHILQTKANTKTKTKTKTKRKIQIFPNTKLYDLLQTLFLFLDPDKII